MPRVSTMAVRPLVQARKPFTCYGSMYARDCGPKGYAVFSYGEHWPLHVWDGAQWYHNSDKRSITTTNHYGKSHPGEGWDGNTHSGEGPHLDCAAMRALVAKLDAQGEDSNA